MNASSSAGWRCNLSRSHTATRLMTPPRMSSHSSWEAIRRPVLALTLLSQYSTGSPQPLAAQSAELEQVVTLPVDGQLGLVAVERLAHIDRGFHGAPWLIRQVNKHHVSGTCVWTHIR
jgi:hypothetical protein